MAHCAGHAADHGSGDDTAAKRPGNQCPARSASHTSLRVVFKAASEADDQRQSSNDFKPSHVIRSPFS
ncbi:hypothetical protein GALL_521950 [mine drainage metagenome]|uniref:Uncharacterized protein n=1 Tax=mine drainage metagenome TaxID=410659 RepID=A0A1J5PEK4_9ZZZZ